MISILYIYISKSRYSDKYRSATILMVIMIIVNSYSPYSFGLCPDVTIIAVTAPSLQGIIIFSTSISPSPNVPSLQGDYLQHTSIFLSPNALLTCKALQEEKLVDCCRSRSLPSSCPRPKSWSSL